MSGVGQEPLPHLNGFLQGQGHMIKCFCQLPYFIFLLYRHRFSIAPVSNAFGGFSQAPQRFSNASGQKKTKHQPEQDHDSTYPKQRIMDIVEIRFLLPAAMHPLHKQVCFKMQHHLVIRQKNQNYHRYGNRQKHQAGNPVLNAIHSASLLHL